MKLHYYIKLLEKYKPFCRLAGDILSRKAGAAVMPDGPGAY